ncbi:MAG: xanthine dehydrogenase family protein subunit M [Immundisolibacteraceae bacterium]|nr:xanthine dehydrogenase family protein subunit M [Immundisolibacteraceae bacterium]
MHSFDFATPTSVSDAVAILAKEGSNARLLAGGTDLLIGMRVGRATPGLVVDAKQIPELKQYKLDSNGLQLGSAVTCRTLYEDPAVVDTYPALIESAELIGGMQTQGRASIGGNLCNAAPSGDSIPTLIVLGAEAVVIGPNGQRNLAVEDVCVAPGKTSLADNELLLTINIPAPAANSGACFQRFIPRNEMDIAIASVASSVVLSGDGSTFESARIALGAVGPTPIFAQGAGDLLAGKPVNEASIQEAADAAEAVATPINDMRGTIEQRKHLINVLTKRTLREAVARAKG